jgi:hypothetical protein
MRQIGIPFPITSYVIPPSAPEAVAEASRELHRIGNLCEETNDDLSDAKQQLVTAKAADVQAIVKATNDGTEVKDPQANERKALAEISRLTSLLRGYQQAADEAGNALAQQIDKHRDEWQESLDETRETAAARYDAAIAEARAALAELIPAQGGVVWVEAFDLGLAPLRPVLPVCRREAPGQRPRPRHQRVTAGVQPRRPADDRRPRDSRAEAEGGRQCLDRCSAPTPSYSRPRPRS